MPCPPRAVPAAAFAPAKKSGMAIASLILGICGVLSCGITALVGLILGFIAMSKIKKSRGALGGGGIAMGGNHCLRHLATDNPALFVVMFLPAFTAGKQAAYTILCVNNMKQLSTARFLCRLPQ